MRLRIAVRLTAVAVGVCAGAAPAAADLVYLSSGRVMSVKAHRVEGDRVVLELRAGGEISCPRSLIADIRPDEVPYPEPVAARPPAGPVAFLPRLYGDLIERVSTTYGVDPRLVQAVIEVESAWDPRAVSRKGAMGLMQLMPATAREYGVSDAFDPGANIEAGTRHLRSLLDRYDLSLALAAYNAGAGAVERYRGIPPYTETRQYVSRVLTRFRRDF